MLVGCWLFFFVNCFFKLSIWIWGNFLSTNYKWPTFWSVFFTMDIIKQSKMYHWLVVSTHLKNISQIGNLPQTGVKIKHMWNHHLDHLCRKNRVSRHASEGWPCWIACRLTQATNAQGATVHCLGQRPGIWVMTRPCTLLVDRWLLQHLPSNCWGDRNVQFGEDRPIITISSMTRMEFFIPTKDPQNSSRSRVHHRWVPNQKTSKMASSKKASPISFVGPSVSEGKKYTYICPKKNSFHPSIQELLWEVGISKISQRNFCSGDFQRYKFCQAANISWRRFRWGVISWRLCPDVLPTHGKLETIKHSWICMDMYGYVVWFFPKFSHYNFYHQQVFV